MAGLHIRSTLREYEILLESAKTFTCHLNAKFKSHSLLEFIGEIGGPAGTPYESGIFLLDIRYSKKHPFCAPDVCKFITPIWHPNISPKTGEISLDILKDKWDASQTLTTLLLSIQSFLGDPEPDCPLDSFIGRQYKEDPELFATVASYWTAVFAGGKKTNAKLDELIGKSMSTMNIDKIQALTLLSREQMNQQEAALWSFQTHTGLSEEKAKVYLEKNNYDFDDALEVYYTYERNRQ